MSILLYVYMHVYLIYITMFPSPHALKAVKKKKKFSLVPISSLSVFDQREFDVMFLLAGLVAGQK